MKHLFNYSGKDIISLDQFSSEDIFFLFKNAEKMKSIVDNSKPTQLLAGTVISLLFYEPSSRTFGSFSSAIKRLGGATIDITNPEVSSSVAKGETLEDTIKVFSSYSNAIIIRHKIAGSAKIAAEASDVPVINAGDGIGEHPTQALLDMFTIYQHAKKLDNLTGLIAGDLLNGRTVHSLLRGLSLFGNNKIYLLSPKKLQLSKADFFYFKKKGLKLVEISNTKDIPKDCDFWYWTRVQKERFKNLGDYEKVKNAFILTPELIKEKAGKNTIFMHPLPRVGEINTKVDEDKRALYLREEIKNGLYIRMALLALVLGKL